MTPEAWLCTHAVRGAEVLSWVNPAHPGYAYPEAAGLLVRWLAQRGLEVPALVTKQLEALVERDAVGRGGSTYAFDTAVVLTGLEALDTDEDPRWTAARARLAQQLPSTIVDPSAEPRWSTVAGPHMLKLAVGTAARAARGWSTPLLETLTHWRVEQDADGRLRTPPHEATYLHAHAYATEGLMALQALGVPLPASVDGAVAFLRACQRDDGSLPAWSDGGPSRTDTTAQAARLFLLHDPSRHADAIARALGFLDGLSSKHGAMVYEPGSADLNTWCTLFAAQARAWAAGELPRPEALL